jgi:hypothetical protein
MSMPGHIAGKQLTIFVSSVQGEDVGRFSDLNLKEAAVLVFIIDPANRSSIPLARLVDAFGLTPAEARGPLPLRPAKQRLRRLICSGFHRTRSKLICAAYSPKQVHDVKQSWRGWWRP